MSEPEANGDTGTVLMRLQRGLESLYRVDTQLDVRQFVVTDGERALSLAGPSPLNDNTRRPREQLLVSHERGELGLALYLDEAALANLERHDPQAGLGEHNFGDFCLAVEGVSHFIYVALCAAADRLVTALELELQAEVDKFVSCVLLERAAGRRAAGMGARLFSNVHFAEDLDVVERARYHTANAEAGRYARALEARYVRTQRLHDMLVELRRFYRLSLEAKLAHIAGAAA